MGICLAVALASDHLAPPLQADFAGQGRVRNLAHTRDLGVERVERLQRGAPIGGSKQ